MKGAMLPISEIFKMEGKKVFIEHFIGHKIIPNVFTVSKVEGIDVHLIANEDTDMSTVETIIKANQNEGYGYFIYEWIENMSKLSNYTGMNKYCGVCEKTTEHQIEEYPEQYECNGYEGEKLISYWICQECRCITDKA